MDLEIMKLPLCCGNHDIAILDWNGNHDIVILFNSSKKRIMIEIGNHDIVIFVVKNPE